jgi:hypothetical protein
VGKISHQQYSDNVALLVRDKSSITVEGKDVPAALKNAAAIYSDYKLRYKVQEYTADGSRIYVLPEHWETGRSESGFTIEYPVDPEADRVQTLDPTMYFLYEEPDAVKIRFKRTDSDDLKPAAGEKFRVRYPVSHTILEGENGVTIPDSDFAVVCFIACAELCLIMSSRLSQMTTQNNGGQTDFQTRGNVFLSIRKEFKELWQAKLVPKAGEVKAADRFGSFETSELHRDLRSLPPRDNSGRQYVD